MSWTSRITWSIAAISVIVTGQLPPVPENSAAGTSFLDHNGPISNYYGQTFLKQQIPFIDIPDSNIQEVYYYRANTLTKHLRYTIADTGYILTEFVNPVGYAQAFNTIDAAAGHQIDEASILRGRYYNNNYIHVYTRGPGDPVQYTQWILDAMYRRSQIDGNTVFTTRQVDDMTRLWDKWNVAFDQGAGLYHYTPNSDAQEYSLPGYITAPVYDGPQTYRPSINAYMVGNARAIASVAAQAGNTVVAGNFTGIANKLQQAMFDHLWDPAQQFFVDVIQPNNPNLSPVTGREEVGFFPYRFGIGLSSTYTQPAVQQLFDTQGFFAPYGPTTLEIRNQYYDAVKPDGYCCYWNGQSWPYSTAHTLTSLATIYRSGDGSVSADQYYQLLGIYATTQHKNGAPYVAESHYPFQDGWSADSTNHSEGYDHSTYCFNVITGLLGLVPRSDETLQISPIIPSNWTYFAIENLAYHDHLLTVLYDSTGSRYNQGSGLTIFVDGTKIYNGPGSSTTVPLPNRPQLNYVVPVNIAANPIGPGHYPMANATYTWHTDWEYKAIDGYLYYDDIPDNRWTNYQSPNSQDTLQVTFARPRSISSVTLAIYQDMLRQPSGAIDVPSKIEIHGSDGLLASSTGPFLSNDRNTISFNAATTSYVAVTMYKNGNYFVGVCELEIWVPPQTGPTYYMVDALLSSASVTTDSRSKATQNGAVVGSLSGQSTVVFSGIDVGEAKTQNLAVVYSNSGSSATTLNILVNQVPMNSVSLTSTNGAYASVTARISLAGGRNFITLSGGSSSIFLETITLSDGSQGNDTASSTQGAAAMGTGKPNTAPRIEMGFMWWVLLCGWLSWILCL